MSKRKLLLADDSVTIQKVVNLTFADEGIDVITVGNGDLAMQKIAEERPDMVLIDVNMPGMSGYEICSRLRGDQETRNLPIMLLVGSFEPFDEEEANRVGANGFLTKPFQSIRQLVAKVSELMPPAAVDTEYEHENSDHFGEPWSAAATEEPENEDIDSLYKQSFAETIEFPDTDQSLTAGYGESRAVPESFADAGMDDEMIETSYMAATAAQADSSENPREGFASPFEETVDHTTEIASDDLQEVQTAWDSEPLESETSTETPAGEYREGEGLVFTELAADSDNEAARTSEWEDSVAEPVEEAEYLAAQTPPGLPAEDVEERYETLATPGPEREPEPEPEFEFDGANLLELPPPPQVADIGTRFTTPDDPGAGQQIVSLSPELMEAIVQKVLDRMSDGRS